MEIFTWEPDKSFEYFDENRNIFKEIHTWFTENPWKFFSKKKKNVYDSMKVLQEYFLENRHLRAWKFLKNMLKKIDDFFPWKSLKNILEKIHTWVPENPLNIQENLHLRVWKSFEYFDENPWKIFSKKSTLDGLKILGKYSSKKSMTDSMKVLQEYFLENRHECPEKYYLKKLTIFSMKVLEKYFWKNPLLRA